MISFYFNFEWIGLIVQILLFIFWTSFDFIAIVPLFFSTKCKIHNKNVNFVNNFLSDEIIRTFSNCRPKIIFSQQTLLSKINETLLAIDHEAQIVLFDDEMKNLEAYVAENKGTDVNFK